MSQLPVVIEEILCSVKHGLMHAVLKALPPEAGLLMVGDPDQLPSVGPGQVLADLIAAKTIPEVHLTEVFRQAAQSRIIQTAHQINAGHMPDLRNPEGLSDLASFPGT
ncbi:AAA family ATPase [Acidithiobacillus ferrooxidans]|uniref:AAA family ATPase n=1 Tax=Acidithiobacillus ferrooxidans TaxID=920 RepID=UPI00214B85B1|nr:AAA family ATPase [Acidithiobacillus ferrooxidans]